MSSGFESSSTSHELGRPLSGSLVAWRGRASGMEASALAPKEETVSHAMSSFEAKDEVQQANHKAQLAFERYELVLSGVLRAHAGAGRALDTWEIEELAESMPEYKNFVALQHAFHDATERPRSMAQRTEPSTSASRRSNAHMLRTLAKHIRGIAMRRLSSRRARSPRPHFQPRRSARFKGCASAGTIVLAGDEVRRDQ